jgi:hypothetical protein
LTKGIPKPKWVTANSLVHPVYVETTSKNTAQTPVGQNEQPYQIPFQWLICPSDMAGKPERSGCSFRTSVMMGGLC